MTDEVTMDKLYDIIELIKLQQKQIDSLQKQVAIMSCKTPEELMKILAELEEVYGSELTSIR